MEYNLYTMFYLLIVLSFLFNRKIRTIIVHFFLLLPLTPSTLVLYGLYLLFKLLWIVSYFGYYSTSSQDNLSGYSTNIYNEYLYPIFIIVFLLTSQMWLPHSIQKIFGKHPFSNRFLRWFINDGLLQINSACNVDDQEKPPIIDPTCANFCLIFPHGIWSYSFCILFSEKFLKHLGYVFSADVLNYVPFTSTFIKIACNFRLRSIGKKSVVNYLTKEKENNLISGIFLGGMADQLKTKPGVNGVNLCNHKGFLRLCLKHGANLNVAYFFNGENMYTGYFLDPILPYLPKKIGWFMKQFSTWFNIRPRNVNVTGYHKHFVKVLPNENFTEDDVQQLYDDLVNFTVDIVKNNLHLTNSKVIEVN
jgi:hypothetical protein